MSAPGNTNGSLGGSQSARTADRVAEILLPTYVRPWDRPALRWCAWWWRHAEAWVRFEACHRAWLELNTPDGTGLSTWHRDHLDPMLRELLGDLGPFARCHPPGPNEDGSHTDPDPYPVVPLEFTVTDTTTGVTTTDAGPSIERTAS